MSDQAVINFTRGVPAPESFPIDEMIAASQRALERYGTTILQYGKAYGFLPLREWLAEWQGVDRQWLTAANRVLRLPFFTARRCSLYRVSQLRSNVDHAPKAPGQSRRHPSGGRWPQYRGLGGSPGRILAQVLLHHSRLSKSVRRHLLARETQEAG